MADIDVKEVIRKIQMGLEDLKYAENIRQNLKKAKAEVCSFCDQPNVLGHPLNSVSPGILSGDTRYPAWACTPCAEKLTYMLQDVDYMRYMLKRYDAIK